MSDDTQDRIEGLEPKALFRAVLGDPSGDPEAAERAAEEELRVRAEIEARLPDLELLELLGRGGMGYVYRARQAKLDREVALKVLAPAAVGQAEFAERFAREARAMARLNHPNIVAVHDYGQDGPFCWLVMEYVDGSNLRDVIRAGKLEPAEALALVPRICDALQFAHNQGVVHRDVKPENILLDGQGGVKIADFGLAKLTGTPAALVDLTGSQQVLGTLRYMAPEQLDHPLEVDHRADIYSLGVVFYEMLTGEIPTGRFDPPSARSAAPTEVDDVVLHALEKDPERRYQRASEVTSDLASVARGERPPLAATDAQPPEREPAPELSMLAVFSAVLAALGFVPFLIGVIVMLRSGVGSNSGSALSMAVVMGLVAGVLGLGLMVTGSAMGFRALEKVRADWPRLYGAGPAVVGAWAGILLVANVAVLAVTLQLWDEPEQVPPIALAFATLMLLLGDVACLVSIRRWFLKRCRAD